MILGAVEKASVPFDNRPHVYLFFKKVTIGISQGSGYFHIDDFSSQVLKAKYSDKARGVQVSSLLVILRRSGNVSENYLLLTSMSEFTVILFKRLCWMSRGLRRSLGVVKWIFAIRFFQVRLNTYVYLFL